MTQTQKIKRNLSIMCYNFVWYFKHKQNILKLELINILFKKLNKFSLFTLLNKSGYLIFFLIFLKNDNENWLV